MTYDFKIGRPYTRRDIYKVIGVPEDTYGGQWHTGYNHLGDDWFLFCHVGVPGRSGEDYGNAFEGDDFRWSGRTGSKVSHAPIHSMLSGKGEVYIFFRTDNRLPFMFAGIGTPIEVKDTMPVEVLWRFIEGPESRPEVPPEEIIAPSKLYEGATKSISVNVYERNPLARRMCIERYGTRCQVCEVDLERVYGPIAQGFIHVHHIRPLSEVDARYQVDPLKDLVPVCPNCHAMLHRRQPVLTVEELKQEMAVLAAT